MSPAEIVLTVKNFLRWNEEKFESLHKDAPKIANPLGWRRSPHCLCRADGASGLSYSGRDVDCGDRTVRRPQESMTHAVCVRIVSRDCPQLSGAVNAEPAGSNF
jgi:hypothetical protein